MSDRKKYIGGSEVSAVMGINPYKSPLMLWAEKTGRVEPKDLSDNEAVQLGIELEDFVAKKFEKKSGLKVRRDSRLFKHPKYDYMVGHIDRWIVGEDALLECKTASAYLEKDWRKEEIPAHYTAQVVWYCGLVGKSKGYIACLIGGQKMLYKEVPFDKELFEMMVEKVKDFWENNVLADKPPVAIGIDNDFIQEMHPTSKEVAVKFEGEESEKLNHLLEERNAGVEQKKEIEAELKAIEAQIKQFIGDNESGETDKWRFTWKTQTRPEMVVKASSFRVLRTYDKNREGK